MKGLRERIKELKEELKELNTEDEKNQIEYQKKLESQLKGKILRIDGAGETEASIVWFKEVKSVSVVDWKVCIQGDGVWYGPVNTRFEIFRDFSVEVSCSDQEDFDVSKLTTFPTVEDMKKDVFEEFEYLI